MGSATVTIPQRVDLQQMLTLAAERGASDVFLKVGSPPCIRLHGVVIPLMETAPLDANQVRQLAYSIMTEDQTITFEGDLEMDLSFAIPGLSRFRVNIYQQRGTLGIVLRLIPFNIRSVEELLLPPVLKDICKQRQGLVLVTGPTGSGKSTTLAAMIDIINQTRRCHIVTMEDPIEYLHTDKRAIVSQREINIDTHSFRASLRTVLRQSPDVILIGEMRDQETFDTSLTAAETGHLVMSTLHTRGAAETVDRIINMFPPHDKQQICMRLSQSLKAVISQQLVPRTDGKGRVAAAEVMVVTPTVAKYIEEGRSGMVYGAISEGAFWGMQTMNQALLNRVKEGLISEQEALARAGNLTELKQMLRRA